MTRPFAVPHELFAVEHRFVDVDDSRIHYVDEGEGETVLLLHGNPAWSFLYRKIIAGLRDEFRCVALDFPGYGMSTAAPSYGFTPLDHSLFLERFAEQLGLDQLTIMVQDWGGPIGLGFAERRPEHVSRLIIGNTFAWPLNRELRVQIFSRVMGGAVGQALTRRFNFTPKRFFSSGFAMPLTPEVYALYMAPWQDPARRRPAAFAPRQLTAASDYLAEVEANLGRISDRPALIVWGARDFAFREEARGRFEQAFPNHRTIVYDDASHFLQEDVGDRIADAFKAFRRDLADREARDRAAGNDDDAGSTQFPRGDR
jgi:haloalkane dehalogenase